MQIKIPFNFSPRLRSRITKMYNLALKECGADEEKYIESKLPKVLARLRRAESGWVHDLALYAEVLYDDVLKRKKKGKYANARRPVLGALFYLCEPWDVIPDLTPGTGYMDDAAVFNACLRKIRSISKPLHLELCQEIERRRG